MIFMQGAVAQSSFSPTFYILILVLLASFVFTVFAVVRLNYGWKEFIRSLWKSLLIAFVIALILAFVLTIFVQPVYEKMIVVDCLQPPCPTPSHNGLLNSLLNIFPFVLAVVYYFTFIIYYLVKLIRKK